MERNQGGTGAGAAAPAGPGTGGPDDFFFIKCNNGYEKIFHEAILFVEACQNYICIHTSSEKYMTLTPMRSLEEQLPAGGFLRIHKSYIVAISKIRSLNGNEVTVGQVKIPVSKNYKDELMKIIDGKLIRK